MMGNAAGQDWCIPLAAFIRASTEPCGKWMPFWRNLCPGKTSWVVGNLQKQKPDAKCGSRLGPFFIQKLLTNSDFTSLPSNSSCFSSVPTLASDGLLSCWVVLSEQIPLGVWNNPLQTELSSYFLGASPVLPVPTLAKRNHAVVLPSLASSADSQGKAILGQMLSYIWGREWSSEQKQYRTGHTVFQEWLLVPVSKSLVSCRSHKISDLIPWRTNLRQSRVCCPSPCVLVGHPALERGKSLWSVVSEMGKYSCREPPSGQGHYMRTQGVISGVPGITTCWADHVWTSCSSL